MKRLFVYLLISTLFTGTISAQKKEIAQAKTYIKSGKDLDKAEASMRTLLNDSANRLNTKVWLTLAEAVRMQYEQGNEKLYLKEKSDTATLFLTGQRLFAVYEGMDSAETEIGQGATPKMRKKNADYLNVFRKNLYSGGVYFVSKQQYQKSFLMLDTYLDCVRQPLFTHLKYNYDNSMSQSAAYLATYSAVMLKNDSLALKYSDIALKYERGREKVLQYLSDIYLRKNDTAQYVATLKTGVQEYPKAEYFFTRIVDYFNDTNNPDSALQFINRSISADPGNTLFLYAKSNLLLNAGSYQECATICDSIIAIDDSLAEAYYNAGVAYLNMAFNSEKNRSAAAKKTAKTYYEKALPYMEKYRSLAPDEQDKWAYALYNIYLNLNMGKKFEEITKLLK